MTLPEEGKIDRILPPEECYEKILKLRSSGGSSTAFEVTIPKEIVERYMRKHGVSKEEATEKLKARIRYDDFDGVLVMFTEEKPDSNTNSASQKNTSRR